MVMTFSFGRFIHHSEDIKPVGTAIIDGNFKNNHTWQVCPLQFTNCGLSVHGWYLPLV